MKKVIFSIIVSLIVAANCNAEEKPIQSFQELCFQAERDALEGNLCEDYEEIASNFWNFCQEKGYPVTYIAYMELARKRPEDCHCDFSKMEKFAQENGYSSIDEYEEAELEKIMKGY